ncbi:DNA-binding protein [Candidatus Hydrogenisulfobacillus filiaventi]|uniref:DNA-binding protein n=1 Tax=Candidatus Hydrogenisulfobacillus filiaventi TaxID=2707344 RepID=A0A6F8ZDK1_9FIRM|nr:HEPN domain-containing protein [Bacillota bacterium]CAB1127689.1 DNA-binding protein [Candidatus Hydrogenisulfobacillus filiaventi]
MAGDERVQAWLTQALDDLDTADLLSTRKFGAAAFFYQQAAEKALKALAMARHQSPWGHSILKLLQSLDPGGDLASPLYQCGRRLDLFYIPTRYPDAFPEGTASEHFSAEDAKEARACARMVIDWVQNGLNN